MPSMMAFGAQHLAISWIESPLRYLCKRLDMMNMENNAMAAALAFPSILSAAFLAFVAAKI